VIAPVLQRVTSGERLGADEMGEVIRAIVSGGENEFQIAALLGALRARGETVDEVAGAAAAMRALAVELPKAPADAVDTAGTGGDGADTFNISTVAALVVAGAGVPVCKHGNRAASSRCGSAELLEELGIPLDTPPARMAESVEAVGIGFLYARACHPAMAAVGGIRAALGVPTIFNRLGPLTNPMGVRRQLLGVGQAEQARDALEVLVRLGCESVWVVHGEDGLDEVTTTAPTRVLRYREGATDEFEIRPGEHVPVAKPADLVGGGPEENAAIARSILGGETGPRRDIVVINAAAALCAAGRFDDLGTAVAAAESSLDEGRARDALARWVAFLGRGA
jgi:anthranilate phosphoribosyltransferase